MESIEAYDFGTLLRKLREQRKLSQEKLSFRLGYGSRGSVDAWEQGKQRPRSIEKVLDLAEALELSDTQIEDLAAAYFSPIFEASKVDHQAERHDCYPDLRLPENYIRRVQVLSTFRTALIDDVVGTKKRATLSAKPIALHGMGGAGKSVIARALCDDPVVRPAFPGGILWATLGKNPNFITSMSTWIDALNGTISESVSTVKGLQKKLMDLLRDRRCLLILDDVWRRTDAEKFLVGGSRCRVLFTTRDSEIAYELGATTYTIPPMTDLEAMKLLEAWADEQLSESSHLLKERIVKRLGCLPLAVKLAGAQLRRKEPDIWLQNFDIRKLKSSRPETVHDNLMLTLSLSLEELSEKDHRLYTALAIFKEDQAILQSGIEKLWQGVGNFSPENTTDLLADLVSRALLEVTSSQPPRAVYLHNLLHDFVSLQLGNRKRSTHKALLDTYRVACAGPGWHTFPDDGYLYDHLAYHLWNAGEIDGLKNLFIDQQWFDVRIPQSNFTYDGYMDDLLYAETQAEVEVQRQIDADEAPQAFADCIRYLLIRTSINSFMRNYPSELVVQAVKTGLWTPQRALSIAAKFLDPLKKIKVYAPLLLTGTLTSKQREEVLQLCNKTYQALDDVVLRAKVLVVLAPHLPEKLRTKLLMDSLKDAYPLWVQEALASLSPQLTKQICMEKDGQRPEEISMYLTIGTEKVDEELRPLLIRLITHVYQQEKAIEILAPLLTRDLLENALEIVLKLPWWGQTKPGVLAALSSCLTGMLRQKALEHGLKAALCLPQEDTHSGPTIGGILYKSEAKRGPALIALVPQITGILLEQVLDAALELSPLSTYRTNILVTLAPRLTGTLLERALGGLRSEASPQFQAALSSLSSDEQRIHILKQVLNYALALPVYDRLEALRALAPLLEGGLLRQAFEHMITLSFTKGELDWMRRDTFLAFAPRLSGELLERSIEVVLGLEHLSRVKVLATLAPNTEGALRVRVLKEVVDIVVKFFDIEARHQILVQLAPLLTGEFLEYALKACSTFQIEESDKEALMGPVPSFPSQLKNDVLEYRLEKALDPNNIFYRFDLRIILHQLTARQIERVLEAILPIRPMDSPNEQFDEIRNTLIDLAPYLEGKSLELVLEDVLGLELEHSWLILRALAPKLTGQLLEKTLEVIPSSKTELYYTRSILHRWAPQLTDQLLEKTLEAIRSQKWEEVLRTIRSQTDGLFFLRRESNRIYSTPQELDMNDIWTIESVLEKDKVQRDINEIYRIQLLADLAPQTVKEDDIRMLAGALENREEPFVWWRVDTVVLLARIILLQEKGSERSIQLLKQALKDLSESERELARTHGLVQLMSWLKGELQKQALEIILGLDGPNRRYQMLVLFIPSLEEGLQKQAQKQALEDALTFRGNHLGTLYLRQLIPYLTGKELEYALKESLALENPVDRAQVLIAFLPLVSDQTQILKSIRRAMVEKLLSIKYLSRELVLDFCCTRELFAPSEIPSSSKAANIVDLFASPILSLECAKRIESHILEICEQWHFL